MNIWKKALGLLQTLTFKAFTNSSPANGEIWYDGTNVCFREGSVTRTLVTASSIMHIVSQSSHGLSVGDVIKVSGSGTYNKASQGSNEANATAVGIVTVVTDSNNFQFVSSGEITTGVPSGAAGTVYWLSTSSGGITGTKPTTLGNYRTQILEVIDPSVKAIVKILPPDLYFANMLKGSATLNFGSTAAQSASDLTITVTGATTNDKVALGLPLSPSNGCYTAWVSAANTVKVRFNNYTSAAVDPASATFEVIVFQTA